MNTYNSNEIQQRFMIHSNSIGQNALNAVISKYVKHNQYTQQTINHHKSWLKSFQNELRNVSNTISHHNHSSNKKPTKHRASSNNKGNGEVVIRLKIEK